MTTISFEIDKRSNAMHGAPTTYPQHRTSDIVDPAYDVIIDNGMLIIDIRGLVDLRLYGFIRRAMGTTRSPVYQILLYFHEIDISDSGYAALMALDRCTLKQNIHTSIVGATTDMQRLMRARCPGITLPAGSKTAAVNR